MGYDAYDRHHRASAPPAAVDLDLSGDAAFGGDPDRLNPEALLVTAAASCQLLSFLAVAARARLDVVDYRDEADAVMPSDDRPVRITEIHLHPRITVRHPATPARVEHLCQVAHRECYIANSRAQHHHRHADGGAGRGSPAEPQPAWVPTLSSLKGTPLSVRGSLGRPEHPLADDVLLDLVAAAVDRHRRREQRHLGQHAVERGVGAR